jgi:hypothetical protein
MYELVMVFFAILTISAGWYCWQQWRNEIKLLIRSLWFIVYWSSRLVYVTGRTIMKWSYQGMQRNTVAAPTPPTTGGTP